VSYIPMALTADRWSMTGKAVTLIADAFAVRVNTDGQGAARSITWRVGATGQTFTEEARAIVLSCGTVKRRACGSTAVCPIRTGGSAAGLPTTSSMLSWERCRSTPALRADPAA
jgi:hypothetical protein